MLVIIVDAPAWVVTLGNHLGLVSTNDLVRDGGDANTKSSTNHSMPRYGRKRPRFNRSNVGAMRMSVRVRRALVPAEKKFIDNTINVAGTHATAFATLLNGSTQGTSASSRVGNKIMIDSLTCRLSYFPQGALAMDTDGEYVTSRVRVMIVVDKQPNGSACAITDVLSTAGITQPRKLDNSARFRVLYDRVISCRHQIVHGTAADTVDVAGEHTFFKINHKFKKPLMVQYLGNTGDVTDIKTNSLYMLTYHTNAGGTAGGITGVARIRYTDA